MCRQQCRHLRWPATLERINTLFFAQEAAGPNGGAEIAPLRRRPAVVAKLRELIPDALQELVGRLSPIAVRDEIVNRTYTETLDWARTPGFAVRADLAAYIRYNIRGRESRGLLDPESPELARYEALVVDAFRSLRVATTGEPVVQDIFHCREIFPGPRSSFLPDTIVTFRDLPPQSRLQSEMLGELRANANSGRAGNHRPGGFCLTLNASAELFAKGPPRHIVDLAPAVFAHFGQLFRPGNSCSSTPVQ